MKNKLLIFLSFFALNIYCSDAEQGVLKEAFEKITSETAKNNQQGVIEYLSPKVNKVIDVNIKDSSDGHTLIHIAAWAGLPEVVQFLINNKADVNALDNEKVTPLARAVMRLYDDYENKAQYQDRLRAIEILLQNKANPNLGKIKPLSVDLLEIPFFEDVKKLLLKYGAKESKKQPKVKLL